MPKASRSMNKAFEMTPEAEAFIRGESSAATPAPKNNVGKARMSRRTKSSSTQSSRTGTSNASRRQCVPPSDVAKLTDDGFLVQITTRMRSETANALRRACLEQKLARRQPNTQQDIIELAVRAWLVELGYFSG